MNNIFQGNELLLKTVAKNLELDSDKIYNTHPDGGETILSHFTEDIYFQSFFYLTRRFGLPIEVDEYKKIVFWDFKVKEFLFRLELNSSWLIVMAFGRGRYSYFAPATPYRVKIWREIEKKKSKLLSPSNVGEWDAEQKKLANVLFEEFCQKENIDDSWDQERFNKEKSYDWFLYLSKYDSEIIDVNYDEYRKKYGNEYRNADINYVLRLLSKFLKNMLTPIWIRDVPYNIKGMIPRDSERKYDRYINNIKFECINRDLEKL